MLAAIMLIGMALRCHAIDRLGIEHFDEGVYASNLWFDASAGMRYPLRHLYAPPLLPTVIEWSLILGGVRSWTPFVASLLAGTALVPSLWWIGRRWFGPKAGITAASLAATSDVHAIFSRMALTDSLLVLFLTWSLYGASETMRGRNDKSFLLAIGAAVAAWWTKYNGWLALAMPLAAAPVWWLFSVPARRRWRSSLAWLAVIALTTCLLWAPVVWDLQPYGGYESVRQNHAKYLTGIAGWATATGRQLANLRLLESGSLALLAPWLVVAATMFVREPSRASQTPSSARSLLVRWAPAFVAVAGWSVANLLAGSAAVLATLSCGLIGLAALSLRPRTNPATAPACLLAVWCLGLMLATPLYHPYARLTLPWLVSTWLVVGWGVAALGSRLGAPLAPEPTPLPAAPSADDFEPSELRFPPAARFLFVTPFLVAAAAFFFVAPRTILWTPSAWQSHATTRAAAVAMVARYGLDASRVDHVVLTYGEPALFYELRAAGARAVVPVGDLETARAIADRSQFRVSLVCGPHARDDAEIRRWLESDEIREQVERFDFAPSVAVLLDRYSPDELATDVPIVESFLVAPVR